MMLQATARTGEVLLDPENRIETTPKARWMDPNAGKFLSVDPLVGDAYDPQAVNAYSYARNNPVSYTDPTGMSCFGGPLGIATSGCMDPHAAEAFGGRSGFADGGVAQANLDNPNTNEHGDLEIPYVIEDGRFRYLSPNEIGGPPSPPNDSNVGTIWIYIENLGPRRGIENWARAKAVVDEEWDWRYMSGDPPQNSPYRVLEYVAANPVEAATIAVPSARVLVRAGASLKASAIISSSATYSEKGFVGGAMAGFGVGILGVKTPPGGKVLGSSAFNAGFAFGKGVGQAVSAVFGGP